MPKLISETTSVGTCHWIEMGNHQMRSAFSSSVMSKCTHENDNQSLHFSKIIFLVLHSVKAKGLLCLLYRLLNCLHCSYSDVTYHCSNLIIAAEVEISLLFLFPKHAWQSIAIESHFFFAGIPHGLFHKITSTPFWTRKSSITHSG